METIFGICAVIGGTVLVCQFVLTLIGLGHADADLGNDMPHSMEAGHHSVGHDDTSDQTASDDPQHAHHHEHSSTWFFGMITFRTVTAALTFFGLAGLAALSSDQPRLTTLAIATAAGLAAMYAVHWMMKMLFRLRAEGNVRIDRAVGKVGRVYLKIPGRRAGPGKIQLNLQNRTVELAALTNHDELSTGSSIVVTAIVGPDTVEVEPVAQPQGVSHV